MESLLSKNTNEKKIQKDATYCYSIFSQCSLDALIDEEN